MHTRNTCAHRRCKQGQNIAKLYTNLPVSQSKGHFTRHTRLGGSHDDGIHQHQEDEGLLHTLVVVLLTLPLERRQIFLCFNISEPNLIVPTLLLIQNYGGLFLLLADGFSGGITTEIGKGLDNDDQEDALLYGEEKKKSYPVLL